MWKYHRWLLILQPCRSVWTASLQRHPHLAALPGLQSKGETITKKAWTVFTASVRKFSRIGELRYDLTLRHLHSWELRASLIEPWTASVFELAWCANCGGAERVKHPCASVAGETMSAASAQYNNWLQWLQTNDTAAFESTWLFVTCSRRLLPKTNLRGFFFKCVSLAFLSFAFFVLFCFVYLRRAHRDFWQMHYRARSTWLRQS